MPAFGVFLTLIFRINGITQRTSSAEPFRQAAYQIGHAKKAIPGSAFRSDLLERRRPRFSAPPARNVSLAIGDWFSFCVGKTLPVCGKSSYVGAAEGILLARSGDALQVVPPATGPRITILLGRKEFTWTKSD
jgi:hypothetical protein